jgi:hypothetical protein
MREAGKSIPLVCRPQACPTDKITASVEKSKCPLIPERPRQGAIVILERQRKLFHSGQAHRPFPLAVVAEIESDVGYI